MVHLVEQVDTVQEMPHKGPHNTAFELVEEEEVVATFSKGRDFASCPHCRPVCVLQRLFFLFFLTWWTTTTTTTLASQLHAAARSAI